MWVSVRVRTPLARRLFQKWKKQHLQIFYMSLGTLRTWFMQNGEYVSRIPHLRICRWNLLIFHCRPYWGANLGGTPYVENSQMQFLFQNGPIFVFYVQRIFFRHVNTVFYLPQILIFIARIWNFWFSEFFTAVPALNKTSIMAEINFMDSREPRK